MTVRLVHVWSSDLGIPASLPFCRPLLARGWEITFICPDGPHVASALAAGMRHLPLALERRLNPPSDVRGTWQLARHLRAGRFQIAHTHNIKVGLISRVVSSAVGVPIVVHTMHGLAYSLDTPPLKRFGHAALERIASRNVDVILAQAEEDRRTVLATRTTVADKVVLIGNGIDLRRFAPDAHPSDMRRAMRAAIGVGEQEIMFLSAGRLVREKGYGELFAAAARARAQDPRIRLVVAGAADDAKADALDPSVLDAARHDGVILLGDRSDMPQLYSAADVVTLCSWREGLPRVLMEGAAMGKPLLASDARGCREVVRPPRNGLLVRMGDASAIAAGMLRLAAEPALRDRLGRENAAEARTRYDIDLVVAKVVGVYYDLLARKGLGG